MLPADRTHTTSRAGSIAADAWSGADRDHAPAPTPGRPGDCRTPRRPVPPPPIEVFELRHPAVPAALAGFRILHLSDLHITARRKTPGWLGELQAALAITPVDLVALTGDYADRPGDEAAALEVLADLSTRWRSRFGAVGVFGNHDPEPLVQRAASAVPGVRWLVNQSTRIDIDAVRVGILGASFPEDVLAASRHRTPADLTLGLVHYPTEIYAMAALGVPVTLAGHTHAGQLRLGTRWLPHASCDLPRSMATGVLQLGTSRLCISRGLGNTILPWRINCPPQAPLYVLQKQTSSDATPELVTQSSW